MECPQGQLSHKWVPGTNQNGNPVIFVDFGRADCAACPSRSACTQAKNGTQWVPGGLTLLPKEQYLTLQAVRAEQTQNEFKAKYNQRAGIEGTLAQGVRAFELRKCRYLGLAKTGLQHVATAAALNLGRVINWLWEIPLERTRTSAFAKLAA